MITGAAVTELQVRQLWKELGGDITFTETPEGPQWYCEIDKGEPAYAEYGNRHEGPVGGVKYPRVARQRMIQDAWEVGQELKKKEKAS